MALNKKDKSVDAYLRRRGGTRGEHIWVTGCNAALSFFHVVVRFVRGRVNARRVVLAGEF